MIATNASKLPTLQVLILAAGQSRRLGHSKALARIHGRALLRSTALTVRAVSSVAPIIVAPTRAVALRNALRGISARWVSNPRRDAGQSSSVRLGLKAARHAPAVLIVPCDLAHLQRRDLARLVSRWRAGRRQVVARRIGPDAAGAPLILPRVHFSLAEHMSGDVGLRNLINALPRDRQRLIALPSAAADIDTRRDLDAARRRWRGLALR